MVGLYGSDGIRDVVFYGASQNLGAKRMTHSRNKSYKTGAEYSNRKTNKIESHD